MDWTSEKVSTVTYLHSIPRSGAGASSRLLSMTMGMNTLCQLLEYDREISTGTMYLAWIR